MLQGIALTIMPAMAALRKVNGHKQFLWKQCLPPQTYGLLWA